MTNRHKHVQPAPRPFNLLVRGGRLIRFKGHVPSGAAQATDEFGVDAGGQDTVTCGARDPSYNDGITYTGSDGLTLEPDDADIEVGGCGALAHDLYAGTKGNGDVLAEMTEDTALIEAGLKAHAVDGVFLSAGYNGELGFSVQEHGLNARVSARF